MSTCIYMGPPRICMSQDYADRQVKMNIMVRLYVYEIHVL